MMQQIRFNGILNLDDKVDIVQPGSHTYANNIRFFGNPGFMTAQNVPGTILVPNSNLPSGTNITIGGFYDAVRKRVIFFNYNSTGRNGIYSYDFESNSITKIFLCFTDSADDILSFSPNYPVHSAVIVYRTEGDGDLLYWTDENNRPRYLNIDTVSTLAPFTEEMINAGKNAPTKPPGNVAFASDVQVNYNAVRNKMFRFAYRWVYVNGEKSTFSPTSIVPLTNVLNPNEELGPTVDNYISVDIYAGDTSDNYSIELFGQISNGSTWDDFFKIDTFVLDEYGIADGGTYTFKFYNNGSYIFVDPKESNLYFSFLPDKANTLELLNGNVIIYGGITEGYAPMQRSEVNVTVTSSLVAGTGKDVYAWRWASDQMFGLVYFDERGKTSGVVFFPTDSGIDTNNFVTTTPQYAGSTLGGFGTVPSISASINHTPPTWAVAYQWVRVNLTPKFIQWVTMDVQTDDNYVYFCIQNLLQFNLTNGFLPSYEFVEGDRLRLLASVGGNGASNAISPQQDYPVLGTVQRTMTSPATQGTFIKCPKTIVPAGGFVPKMMIEVYTPIPRISSNNQIFYEWGQRYAIYESGGFRYHRGQTQDQTGSQAATFAWTNGDVYVKYRAYPQTIPITNTTTLFFLYMMDAMWNEYVPSATNSNSRGWIIDPNANQIYRPTQSRWGQSYIQDTDINQLNIFYPNDFDTYDLAKGAVRRFKARDRIMRVFQERGIGEVGVFSKFIKDSGNTTILETSDTIITTNNIQYYIGEFGMGSQPCSLISASRQDYICDPVRGYQLRISGDGITPISELYKGQFYIRNLILQYNQSLVKQNGFLSYLIGAYNYLDEEAVFVLPGGEPSVGIFRIGNHNERGSSQTWNLSFTGAPREGDSVSFFVTDGTNSASFSYTCIEGDTTQTISAALVALINTSAHFTASTFPFILNYGLKIQCSVGTISAITTITLIGIQNNYTFSFNEKRNGYSSFFDYHPEWITSCQDLIVSFLDGQLYTHNSSTYAHFYGTQYDCSIELPINRDLVDKKYWLSITETGNRVWSCPLIYTSSNSYAGQRQETSLIEEDFQEFEGQFIASIMRDGNSYGGILNGDFIKGAVAVITFRVEDAETIAYLNEISVLASYSPLTSKAMT